MEFLFEGEFCIARLKLHPVSHTTSMMFPYHMY